MFQSSKHLVLLYMSLIVNMATSYVMPLVYMLLYLSLGNLTSPTCLATANDWRVFWENFTHIKVYPLWTCMSLFFTRAWIFYESNRLVAFQELTRQTVHLGTLPTEWAAVLRVGRYVLSVSYALCIDLGSLLWYYLKDNVCPNTEDELANLSTSAKHIVWNVCYHSYDINILSVIMLHIAFGVLFGHFVLGIMYARKKTLKLS